MPRIAISLFMFLKFHRQALLDEEDLQKYGHLTARLDTKGYIQVTQGGVRKLLHRLILSEPAGMIDHINQNKLDNRRENLRVVTNQQNMANTVPRVTNKSGFKGVHFIPNKARWQATICFNGKTQHIGYAKTAEEAARKYDTKAKQLFGEYAYLNFPEES